MDAPAGQCSFCGGTATRQHHLTGRGPSHDYLHPDATVDLCHRDHEFAHAALRAQNADRPPESWILTARLEWTLRRIAAFMVCQAAHCDNPIWSTLATLIEECADQIGWIDLDLHPISES